MGQLRRPPAAPGSPMPVGRSARSGILQCLAGCDQATVLTIASLITSARDEGRPGAAR